MELKDVLAQQQAKEARLRQLRENVAAELGRIDLELDEVTADVTVLSRLVARYDSGVASPAVLPAAPTGAPEGHADAIDWPHLPRMQAVERVLHEAGEAEPAEILEVLGGRGRNDTSKSIHAALGHLKLKGRATQSARGRWIPLNNANGQVPKEITSEES